MRISDWSSDVCSSDLLSAIDLRPGLPARDFLAMLIERGILTLRAEEAEAWINAYIDASTKADRKQAIGRAACRERLCQYVSISVGAVPLQKQRAKARNTITERGEPESILTY